MSKTVHYVIGSSYESSVGGWSFVRVGSSHLSSNDHVIRARAGVFTNAKSPLDAEVVAFYHALVDASNLNEDISTISVSCNGSHISMAMTMLRYGVKQIERLTSLNHESASELRTIANSYNVVVQYPSTNTSAAVSLANTLATTATDMVVMDMKQHRADDLELSSRIYSSCKQLAYYYYAVIKNRKLNGFGTGTEKALFKSIERERMILESLKERVTAKHEESVRALMAIPTYRSVLKHYNSHN